MAFIKWQQLILLHGLWTDGYTAVCGPVSTTSW